MNQNKEIPIARVVSLAMMAAIVYVLTLLRFPLGGSKVHLANAACLLSGLLFGPVGGGVAAGLGSGLYDLLNGYGPDEALITFVSKFAMAAICALIAGRQRYEAVREGEASFAALYRHLWKRAPRVMLGCVIGAASYVALYMLKTFCYQHFVYGNPVSAALVVMETKLPASAINAVFAMVAAPLLYAALWPALRKAGIKFGKGNWKINQR